MSFPHPHLSTHSNLAAFLWMGFQRPQEAFPPGNLLAIWKPQLNSSGMPHLSPRRLLFSPNTAKRAFPLVSSPVEWGVAEAQCHWGKSYAPWAPAMMLRSSSVSASAPWRQLRRPLLGLGLTCRCGATAAPFSDSGQDHCHAPPCTLQGSLTRAGAGCPA